MSLKRVPQETMGMPDPTGCSGINNKMSLLADVWGETGIEVFLSNTN
jgi:hypothetical protein